MVRSIFTSLVTDAENEVLKVITNKGSKIYKHLKVHGFLLNFSQRNELNLTFLVYERMDNEAIQMQKKLPK